MPPIAQTINVPAPSSASSTSSSSSPPPPPSTTAAARAGSTPQLASTPPSSSQPSQPPSLANSTPRENCPKCDKPISGPYVRALGGVFHAPCFTCLDCGAVVVQKFFSFELQDGKQVPLCETDYFRRLDLLCAKCGQALRAGYITSSDKKYHPDHFTCSICPTVFGQDDSYYEHHDQVYCYFHYSTRCAARCASCHSAILKQYVEINRNYRDETYHPECYMISKFWNVKLAPARPSSAPPLHEEEEKRYTPATLREFQRRMDSMVHRIWTVLSAFEESSAACISDMLRFVSDGSYLDAVRSAERFIFHVEVLLAALDDIHHLYVSHDAVRAFSYARESRMLCRKTVDLFTSLSNTQKETSRQGMTQELLALITGIAHFLKILIRIALLGALKLQREYPEPEGVSRFLDPLQRMAEENGDPTARRLVDSDSSKPPASYTSTQISISVSTQEPRQSPSTKGVFFGFKSLAPELSGVSPCIQEYNDARDGTAEAAKYTPPSDLCLKCQETIEDDCVRLGTFLRWHAWCLTCIECGRAAGSRPVVKEKAMTGNGNGNGNGTGNGDADEGDDGSHDGHEHRYTPPPHTPTPSASATPSTPPEQPSLAARYVYHSEDGVGSAPAAANGVLLAIGKPPNAIYCPDHRKPDTKRGFYNVTRLEQYAFLLTVALRRLYFILKRRGAIVPPTGPLARISSSPTNRESTDMMRMKSFNLDRKTSLTARTPRRSTILQGPTGKVAQATDHNQQGPHQHSSSTQNANSTAARRPSRAALPLSGLADGNSPASTNSSASLTSAEGVAPAPGDGNTVRPAFARHNTQVIIRREPSEDTIDTVQLTAEPEEHVDRVGGGGGRRRSRESEVLMLHDISSLVEAEHAKERRMSSVSAGKGTPTDVPGLAPLLLTDLDACDAAIVKHAAVWLLSHSELRDKFDLDEVLELIEIRKAGIWNKIFKGEKKGKKKGVFGVLLSELVEREGVDSTLGVGRVPVRVPSFVDDVITAMKQMDVSVEGIFRKNGNIRRLKEVIEELEKDPGYGDFASDNPVQLAALLKKFFKELPDPLLTFKLHGLFIATQTIANEEERQRLLHLVSVIMPKSHRSTMEVFFAFLKWVSLFSHGTGCDAAGSKMDLPNLSTVIAPSVLYAKGNDALRDQSLAAIRVVTQMLEEQDIFNEVPEQCLPLLEERREFAKYMNDSSKDFLKRVDAVSKGKKSGGSQSGVTSPLISPVNAAPFQVSSFKLDQGPDVRGRQSTPPERPGSRPSQSLERSGEKKEKERNTLRKPKPIHPGLPHAPYSMPPLANGSGVTIPGSSSRPVSPPPGAAFAVSTNGAPAVRTSGSIPTVWKPATPLPLSPPEPGNGTTSPPRP